VILVFGLSSMGVDSAEADTKIIGGEIATPFEYPFVTAVLDVRTGGSSFNKLFCGAALLSKKWLLTAAHCTIDVPRWALRFEPNRHNLKRPFGKENSQQIKAKRVINHYAYDSVTIENDIALVKLKWAYRGDLPKVYIDDGSYTGWGVSLTVAGWGYTVQDDKPSPKLKKTEVDMISHKSCKRKYGAGHVKYQSMFCAWKKDEYTDTCQGDSGGPAFVSVDDYFVINGVTSWGYDCASSTHPGVYTRLSSYKKWIEKKTGLNLSPPPKEKVL